VMVFTIGFAVTAQYVRHFRFRTIHRPGAQK
jgi:hypothetical protein